MAQGRTRRPIRNPRFGDKSGSVRYENKIRKAAKERAAANTDVWATAKLYSIIDPTWFCTHILRSPNDPWQVEVMNAVADGWKKKCGLPTEINHVGKDKITIRAPHGPGKEQPVDEPVLTPSGWKAIGDLHLDDQVITVDGTSTSVIGIFPQGVKSVYRLTMSDGSWVRAGAEHLWQVDVRTGSGRKTMVLSTLQLLDGVAQAGVPMYRLPTVAPIDLPTRLLPIDPYVLGVWLGDGSAKGGKIHKPDDGLWQEVEKIAASGPWRGRTTSGHRTVYGLGTKLEALGLHGLRSWERYIPDSYLYADIKQRHAILQGLFDTDGWVEDQGCAVLYCTTSPRLAEQVPELVRSLGGQVRVHLIPAPGYTHKGERRIGRPAYTIRIMLPQKFLPFRAVTKASRFRPRPDTDKNRVRTLHRYIERIELEPAKVESVCIAVAHPSHLYVTRHHIVTHNTHLAAKLMHWFNFCFHGRIVCTAPKQMQLRTRLWPEFLKVMRDSLPEYQQSIQYQATKIVWNGDDTWYATAETGSKPENIAGHHDEFMLVIVDEASGVHEEMFPAVEAAQSSGIWQVILLIGNPTRTSGTFWASHNQKSVRDQYFTYHITRDKAPRIKEKWIQDQIAKYGENSAIVKVRCYGEFADLEADQLIALDWLESAIISQNEEDGKLDTKRLPVGWQQQKYRIRITGDIADGGVDECVFTVARIYEEFVLLLRQYRKSWSHGVSVIESANFMRQLWLEYNCQPGRGDTLVVDSMGVGAGTAGKLLVDHKLPVIRYAGGSESDDSSQWRNRRVQSYLVCRNGFRDGWVYIDENFLPHENNGEGTDWDDFYGQMCGVKRKPGTERVEDLETKAELLKRTQKSPDMADSVAMVFATQRPVMGSQPQDALLKASPIIATKPLVSSTFDFTGRTDGEAASVGGTAGNLDWGT
jgi:hypothetical protein